MSHGFELFGLLGTAFVVGLSGALMPGPLLAVTISETPRRGAVVGPLLILGHMLLEGGVVAAVALGLASFLRQPAVISVISLIGGAVMCWMGQSMIRSAGGLSLETPHDEKRSLHPILAGILVSLSNPYWTLWWATIGFSYVIWGLKLGPKGVVAFFIGHILSDFAWYTFVSLAVSRGRALMSDKVYRGLIRVCAGALILFGAWFLWTGLHPPRIDPDVDATACTQARTASGSSTQAGRPQPSP